MNYLTRRYLAIKLHLMSNKADKLRHKRDAYLKALGESDIIELSRCRYNMESINKQLRYLDSEMCHITERFIKASGFTE